MQNSIPKIYFDYSINDEIARVTYTIKKYGWYMENGYKPTIPAALIQRVESNAPVEEEAIREAIDAEYNKNRYENAELQIKEGWQKIEEHFFNNLKNLKLPIHDEYHVCLTRYGTSGSYGVPNDIQINIEKRKIEDIPQVIAHETVHLTIEHLIKEYKIDHWTKERIVNLVMNKFFPEKASLQSDPHNAEFVNNCFEANYPDIKKIIEEISGYNKAQV